MKLAICGSSGFIGQRLKKNFLNVIEISKKDFENNNLNKIQEADVVINLAGAPIIKRWNKDYKKLLISSRLQTTQKLVEVMKDSNVKHFISTSAVGIYPDNMDSNEQTTLIADDFLGKLCFLWEKEATKFDKKVTILRLGIVLDGNGGTLKQMALPFKLCLGGVIGRGKEYMSWIDLEDLVNIYKFIISKELIGVINATSVHIVSNKEFTKVLGRVLNRPTFIPLPKFIIKLIYGEGSSAILSSKKVMPRRLLDEGFVFKYPKLINSLRRSFNK